MPINHLSLVNQKLAYAGSIISVLNIPLSEPNATQRLQQQALGDAAVFHLAMALHFYLREHAEQHRIKNLSGIGSVQDLFLALQQEDKSSSESSELLELVQTTDTWLNQLTRYYDLLFRSPEKPRAKKAFGQENRIELIELTEIDVQPTLQLTPALLASWLDSFRALVMRQRETSAEY
ncbi:MAG: hypothetical protein K0Q78_1595 [Cellvibrio sp.]|jgi:hypothetical protein|nr:hypothetical protein [Cellvibrio sp.]